MSDIKNYELEGFHQCGNEECLCEIECEMNIDICICSDCTVSTCQQKCLEAMWEERREEILKLLNNENHINEHKAAVILCQEKDMISEVLTRVKQELDFLCEQDYKVMVANLNKILVGINNET